MKISGTTALVTGATGGIGQAIARDLAARGATVVVTGRRADVLEPLAADLGAKAIVADLSDREAAAGLLDEAGQVDILVANAALPASGLITEYELDAIDRALDVNLRVPIVMARLAATEMIERGRGHLVFVSSISGKVASGGASLYNATKFGMRGFTLGLREELRPQGVGVSTIYPGFIREAGMFADAKVDLPRGVGTRSPEDVAHAVARSVERDTAEIDVAPLSIRMSARIAGVSPALVGRMQRMWRRGPDHHGPRRRPAPQALDRVVEPVGVAAVGPDANRPLAGDPGQVAGAGALGDLPGQVGFAGASTREVLEDETALAAVERAFEALDADVRDRARRGRHRDQLGDARAGEAAGEGLGDVDGGQDRALVLVVRCAGVPGVEGERPFGVFAHGRHRGGRTCHLLSGTQNRVSSRSMPRSAS